MEGGGGKRAGSNMLQPEIAALTADMIITSLSSSSFC